MGRTTAGSLPAIRKHQGVGQYYVRLVRDGVAQTYYLGRLSDGLETAQRRYEDLIENYLKRKKKIPAAGTATVARVIGDFLDYAENRYQKHGRSTGTYERFKRVLRPFLERFGEVKIADFGLDQLAEYRAAGSRSRCHGRRSMSGSLRSSRCSRGPVSGVSCRRRCSGICVTCSR